MILCRHCGSPVEPDESFCADCGKPALQINPESVSTSRPQLMADRRAVPTGLSPVEQKSAKRFPFVAVGLVIILLTATASVAITLAWINAGKGDLKSNASDGVPSTASNTSGGSTPVTETGAIQLGSVPLRISVTASSTRSPDGSTTYDPRNVVDGSPATAWDEGVKGPGVGEWIRCDFDRQVKLLSMRIAPGYFKNAQLWAHNNRLAAATLYFSDGSSRHLSLSDRMAEQSFEVGGVRTSWVRMTIDAVFAGSIDSEDTPISEIAFNWEP